MSWLLEDETFQQVDKGERALGERGLCTKTNQPQRHETAHQVLRLAVVQEVKRVTWIHEARKVDRLARRLECTL